MQRSATTSSFVLTATFILTAVMLNALEAYAAVTTFGVSKSEVFQQTSNTQPLSPNEINGLLDLQSADGDLANAHVTMGASPISPVVLQAAPFADGVFQFSKDYATVANLDSDLPGNVQYQFAIGGGTLGTKTATLTTPATDLFPPIPTFTGSTFSQLQNVNPTQPISFTFNGFSPSAGINASSIEFQIVDPRFGTLFDTSVSSSTTSLLLPANTLDPGITYRAFIIYTNSQFAQNAGFSGASSFVGFSRETDLSFTTAVPEPSSLLLLGAGGIALLAYCRGRRRT